MKTMKTMKTTTTTVAAASIRLEAHVSNGQLLWVLH